MWSSSTQPSAPPLVPCISYTPEHGARLELARYLAITLFGWLQRGKREELATSIDRKRQ